MDELFLRSFTFLGHCLLFSATIINYYYQYIDIVRIRVRLKKISKKEYFEDFRHSVQYPRQSVYCKFTVKSF
jgi:hypothetical protein